MCEKVNKWYDEARRRPDTNAFDSMSLDAYLSLYDSYFREDGSRSYEAKNRKLLIFKQCLEIVEKGLCHVHDIGNENPESLDLHGSILASVLKGMKRSAQINQTAQKQPVEGPSDEKERTNQSSNAETTGGTVESGADTGSMVGRHAQETWICPWARYALEKPNECVQGGSKCKQCVYSAQIQVAKIQCSLFWGCFSVM